MTPERAARAAAEESIVHHYAQMIRESHTAAEWRDLNRTIVEQWSVTALNRIKRRAWAIVERGR